MNDLDPKLHPNILKAVRLATDVESRTDCAKTKMENRADDIRATAACAADIVSALDRLRIAVDANTSAIKRPGVS